MISAVKPDEPASNFQQRDNSVQNAVGGVKDTLREITATAGFSLPGTPCFALLLARGEKSARVIGYPRASKSDGVYP
jgi:hypothetical protein